MDLPPDAVVSTFYDDKDKIEVNLLFHEVKTTNHTTIDTTKRLIIITTDLISSEKSLRIFKH
jgi:hypothetical protein